MRILALAGLSTTLLGTAGAEIESEFSAGYTTDYIFRGGDVGPHLFDVTLAFSGSGEVGGLGELDWTAGIWYASFSNDTGATDASNNELDIFGEASKSISDAFAVAVGITNYSYFGNAGGGVSADDDIEPYVSLRADVQDISLAATAYYDGANNYRHDFYFEFTASWEKEVCQNTTVGLEAILGWFDESNAVPADDSDIFFGGAASVSYAVSDNITVTPHVSATFSDNLGDYVFGGVSVGFGF